MPSEAERDWPPSFFNVGTRIFVLLLIFIIVPHDPQFSHITSVSLSSFSASLSLYYPTPRHTTITLFFIHATRIFLFVNTLDIKTPQGTQQFR